MEYNIKIETGKFYLKYDEDGYIVDAIEFDPRPVRDDYSLFEVDKLPDDINSQCYKNVNGVLERDEVKYQEYLEEINDVVPTE